MKIMLWRIVSIFFMVAVFSCNAKAPEELKTNVLKSYKDDIDLLEKYHFPYPFLKEKIKKENINKRNEIQNIIKAYESHQIIEDEKENRIIDRYTYNLGVYGKAYIEIIYDKYNSMVSIDESGSSLMIIE